MTKFKHYPQRPDALGPEYLQAEFGGILDTLPAADAATDAALWLKPLPAGTRCVPTSRVSARAWATPTARTAWTRRSRRRTATSARKILPVQEEGDSQFLRALGATPHRAAIAAHYGQYFLDRMAAGQQTVEAVNSDLRVQLGGLAMQYDKAIASGEVTVGGEAMTLTKALGIAQGSDQADVRREAYVAYRDWFVRNRESLAGLYARMVALRDRMGRNLGHANFVPLGYAGMSRTDYGPAQAAQFRRGVRDHFVPLQRKLIERQARELGTPTLKPWDAGFHPSLSIPLGAVPVEGQLDAAQRVFTKLSPRLAGHFEHMRANSLIDLENRKGKRGGAFCTSFPDTGEVAIFCNSTGQASDVRTLTPRDGTRVPGLGIAGDRPRRTAMAHRGRCGDPFDGHGVPLAQAHRRILRRRGTCPALSQEALDRRRGAGLLHLRGRRVPALGVREPFGLGRRARCAVGHGSGKRTSPASISPASSPTVMRAGTRSCTSSACRSITSTTPSRRPGRCSGGDGREGPAAAMETYLALCRTGGTKGVLDIFRSAGLRSPFDEGVMAGLAGYARRECELS